MQRDTSGVARRICASMGTGTFNFGSRIYEPGADRLWRWMAFACAWNVDASFGAFACVVFRYRAWNALWTLLSPKRVALGSVFDSGLCNRGMDMKKKGRFVLEASLLMPGFCLLFVCLFFLTLYVHDYTVCFHMMLQTGIKGIYPVSRTDRQIEEEVKKDLTEKLSGYLLWLEEEEINVQADPVSLTVSLSGTGGAFPTEQISIKQKLYRIKPCEMIRRSRWLRNRGGESDGDTL